MNNLSLKMIGSQSLCSGVLLASMVLFSGTVLADRPEWAGRGGDSEGESVHKNKQKHGKGRDRDEDERRESRHQQREQDSRGGIEIRIGGYFGDTQRTATQEYYREKSRSGHCPPGLAKKNSGCLPPGQVKKWAMGDRLSREVKYVAVEPEIQVRLGLPPEGHKFVRVASDILLIAVGTGMVIDAIQDLGQ